mmetsp:Transcript_18202/g.51374  ORF Transcript_18202/g.51374 Transcript_18202/m.51374 type:complete len:265 (-) Transcript_18202:182-976(-)|eukprot:CAMPEP_0119119978 /NCGR_PEP_ID=MMETSP1310-20130426/1232_1 /TAXON_ID=464262 /ORGANISM="Genus nov. species nov., Strain RCC2339" /LENGTH=264 /DNA_ID=CAMNT_0007109439 /DNA_START=55 /DNA_END=849 /DNA_ORIENTATION=+
MLSQLCLKGKTALVGGSTQGIGWAAAQELARLDAKVVLIARNEESLKGRVKELPAPSGQEHSYLVADYSEPDQVKKAVEQLISSGEVVHVVVNNTGGPPGGQAIAAGTEEYEKAFRQHIVCNQILAQAVVEGMKQAGYGRIINVISTSVKQPIPNLGVSNTIRGATANWAKTLAMELGPFGITVNNVLPGLTTTGRLESIIANRANRENKSTEQVEADLKATVPARRFASPAEVAYAIAYLASPAASYVNGTNLPVDGGRTKNL